MYAMTVTINGRMERTTKGVNGQRMSWNEFIYGWLQLYILLGIWGMQ